MADLLVVQQGALPWRPADSAELVEEYDRFNVPTLGVVRQHGVEYLFRQTVGFGGPVTLWSYTLLRSEQRERLDDADSPEDFDQILGESNAFPAVVAMVAEGFGIVSWREIVDDNASRDHLSAVLDELWGDFYAWADQFKAAAQTQRASAERSMTCA